MYRESHIVKYRPAPAANRTAHNYEESLGYTSGFAHSKTDYEHGTSEAESEQSIPLLPAHEAKLLKPRQVIVQFDGERSTIAQRLDWHDFPELERRANMLPPEVSVLPPLPFDEYILSVQHTHTREPLASWHFAPDLYQRLPSSATSNGAHTQQACHQGQ